MKEIVKEIMEQNYVLNGLANANKEDVLEYLTDILTNHPILRNEIYKQVRRENHESDIELALIKEGLETDDDNIILLLTDEYERKLAESESVDTSLDYVICKYIKLKGEF